VQFGGTPNIVYSDFFGDAPYRLSWNWYTLYWLLFCGLLAVLSIMFWPRGKQDRWKGRQDNAGRRFNAGWKVATLACLLAFIAAGGWIRYNNNVINRMVGPRDLELRQADYEKNYKQFDKLHQPRVRSLRYAIDIFPESRNIVMSADEVIQNPYPEALKEIHFTMTPNYDVSIEIPGATLARR